MGQTSLNYDQCKRAIDFRNKDDNSNGSDQSFDENRSGSQRRTYGNLCTGSTYYTNTGSSSTTSQQGTGEIDSRIGDPFRRLCDIINENPNVLNMMYSGNSPHTIFAPTDAAFAKIEGLLGRLDNDRILELHVLPQARLTRDLRCGQTYRTINTQQDRRFNQRSKTRCINASRAQQVGPGNSRNGLHPTIGVPDNVFSAKAFEYQTEFIMNFNNKGNSNDKSTYTFSQDIIACNGVIHVVDEVMLPGNNGFVTGALGRIRNNYPPRTNLPEGSPYYGLPGGGLPDLYYGPDDGVAGGLYYDSKGSNRPPISPPILNEYYGGGYYTKFDKKNKKNKGYKGYKGARAGNRARSRRRSQYYSTDGNPQLFNYYGRNLAAEAKTAEVDFDADADELFISDAMFFDERAMTDAKFFGTEGLVEDASEQENGANDGLNNRKRRLEAMLEPDGKITEV